MPERAEPRRVTLCPECHRVMSIREAVEQGMCNECYEAWQGRLEDYFDNEE